MSKQLIATLICVAIWGIFISGMILGGIIEETKWQRKSVKQGYAEWIVDQKTGETTWQWKETHK